MYGAIIGDLAGSIYEYGQLKRISPVVCQNIIEKNSFISDDTILTIAILDAIVSHENYGNKLKEYINLYKNYKPNIEPYFDTPFSPSLIDWSKENCIGKSSGNGAMMRISSVGYLFNSIDEVIFNAKEATIPSHNTTEAIDCATLIASIIFYARKGYSKYQIIKLLQLKLINKEITKFNTTCSETLDICLYTVFNSNSYEECIRKILLYGGDTDTNACIVGSIAEALFGINDKLVEEANKHIPIDFQKKLDIAYRKININLI